VVPLPSDITLPEKHRLHRGTHQVPQEWTCLSLRQVGMGAGVSGRNFQHEGDKAQPVLQVGKFDHVNHKRASSFFFLAMSVFCHSTCTWVLAQVAGLPREEMRVLPL
jgi:hypothetical protein